MPIADIADWWDEQHKISKEALDGFVEKNPNLFGVTVATTLNTSMDLAASSVDALRFGQGMAKGTLGGLAEDAGRFVVLMGPLGKAGAQGQSAVNHSLAKLVHDPLPAKGICAWVSTAQGLRQVGFSNLSVTVEDAAQAMGKTMTEIGGLSMQDWMGVFKQMGANPSAIKAVSSFKDIEKMTPHDGSIVAFTMRAIGKTGKDVGHAAFAFRDAFGKVLIMDRTAAPIGGGGLAKIHKSLEELSKTFKDANVLVTDWKVEDAAVIENVFGKVMTAASDAGVLAIPVKVATGLSPELNETIAQAFEIFKKAINKQPLSQQQKGYTVTQNDTLQTIAKSAYGDESKWPLIYEANRAKIGEDPRVLKPDQKLVIPDVPKTLSFPPKPRKVEPQIATVDDPDDDAKQDSKTTTQEDPKQRHKHKPKQSGKTDTHDEASHD